MEKVMWLIDVIQGIELVVVTIALLSRFNEEYVGYGWVLQWQDGRVVIISRLIDSPSGREKVTIGSILIELNGILMDFSSGKDFVTFMESLPERIIGEPCIARIQEPNNADGVACVHERTITMNATIIRGPIPVHRSLHINPDDRDFRLSLFWCERTGQPFFKAFLSDSAINRVLSR